MGPRVASQVDDPPRTAPNALANVWARRLADRGLTHPSLRAEWLKDARRGVVTQSDFELLRLRVEDRLGPLEVGALAGISSEAVRRRMRRAALLLVAAHVDQAPAWRQARDAGASDEDPAPHTGRSTSTSPTSASSCAATSLPAP